MVSGMFLNELVYDASDESYIAGVTNFNIDNVYKALNTAHFQGKKENLTIQMDVSVYNRLDDQNLIDHRSAVQELKKMKVEINPVAANLSNGVIESRITNSDGKYVILRTREF